MRVAVAFGCLALSACVSTSSIVSMEGGKYAVTADADGPGMASVHDAALKKAAAFCAGNGTVEAIDFQDSASLNRNATTLSFRCRH